MRRAMAVAVTVLGLTMGLPASAAPVNGLTGAFAPGTWTGNRTGNLTGASGGTAAFTPTTLTLTGGNAISPNPPSFVPACTGSTSALLGPCEFDVTTGNGGNTFAFDWAYTTTDTGGPPGDIFGYIADGVRFQLSDPGGPISQSGHTSVAVKSSFGWFVNCTDCIEGAATATISAFQAAADPGPQTIPTLSEWGLLLSALLISTIALLTRGRFGRR
jgi:hypothetical protein